MTRGLNHLQFVPLGQWVVERSKRVDPCLRSWWDDSLALLYISDWFEEENIGNNLLWLPTPAVMENSLYLLLEARLQQPHKTHLVVVP